MNRYLNSFFITSFLYLSLGIVFIYAINEISIETKQEESITKISLNSVAIKNKQERIEEKFEEPIVKEKVEPIIEQIVEKPAPKVIEKPKKIEKKIEKKLENKPLEKVAEKPLENIQEVSETTKESIKNDDLIKEATTAHSSQTSKTQNLNLENEYLAKVKAKIEKNKIYPKAAKRLNQTGKVVVCFDILKDGKVTNIKILENSKFEKLDSASIELLINIGFFEAIPNELNKTVWNITIPINYQIN